MNSATKTKLYEALNSVLSERGTGDIDSDDGRAILVDDLITAVHRDFDVEPRFTPAIPFRFLPEANATTTTAMVIPFPNIDCSDIASIAPANATAAAIDDAVRMLEDQGLEPTAGAWLAICQHFLSQHCISAGYRALFTRLSATILHQAITSITVEMPSAEMRGLCPVCHRADCQTKSDKCGLVS